MHLIPFFLFLPVVHIRYHCLILFSLLILMLIVLVSKVAYGKSTTNVTQSSKDVHN